MLKRLVIFVSMVFGAGCGPTPCEELDTRVVEALNAACAGETCPFCDCLSRGLALNAEGECYQPEPLPECTPEQQDEAQECLDNPDCREAIVDSAQATVDAFCP